MEWNKDEAKRAKEIAEKKLKEMDIAGANKFALKAQKLYPKLEGLSDLLASLHVYSFADAKGNGEVDWYGVIGVEPSADDDEIRRHYKQMALALHPDKNKSVGADGAFKILSQAWTVLSDKNKKIAYDHKQNLNGIFSKVEIRNPSAATHQNMFPFFPNTRDQKTAIPLTPQRMPKASTFWTICPSCMMQFEYAIEYVRANLVCTNCHRQFKALEIRPPNIQHPSWAVQNRNSYVLGKNPASSGFSGVDLHKNSTFQSGGVGSVGALASRKQLKRKHEEANKTGASLATGSSKYSIGGDRPKKKRSIDAHRLNGDGIAMMKQTSAGIGNGRFESGDVAGKSRVNYARELSQLENAKLLMQKAKKEIGKQMNLWSMTAASRTNDKPEASGVKVKEEEKGQMKEINEKPKPEEKQLPKAAEEKQLPKAAVEKQLPKADVGCAIADAMGVESLDDKKNVQSEKVYPENSNVDSDMNSSDPMSMSVPDPDFHDFDGDRTEKSFDDNQVWAAYDNDDGMPRYYAMIHSVISFKPFKMKMSWLNTKSNNELGPLNWVGSGFYKTCGDFRIGKYVVDNSLNSFSHMVKWSKGTKGAIQIYPAKGDVWALYRNWSPDWDELTPDEVIHKYDMVEVVGDYDGNGVTVAPLVKVAGFKTVFRQQSDTKEFIKIPRDEMFRLSHQVPSYKLTGQEGQNAPKDCLELDPAAMPLELLQVTTEDKEAKLKKTAEGLMVYSRRRWRGAKRKEGEDGPEVGSVQ